MKLLTIGYFILICIKYCQATSHTFNKTELASKRESVRSLINFSLDKYLQHGFPYDEVKPISCEPKFRNFDDLNDIGTNDVLGNFTTTLIDSLSTAAVLGDRDLFFSLTNLVHSTYESYNMTFAMNSTVQVFETTIRIIGGLISSHLYATDPNKKVFLGDDYRDSFLLNLARDMADRLLKAYLTPTGLPFPRINLLNGMTGLPNSLINENNAAGIASPIFEFTLLSYLTHDEKYAKVSRFAFDKIWAKRSPLDLLPMSLNPLTTRPYMTHTGIGASVDSFYEYALKSSILFNDDSLYTIWEKSYNALKVTSKSDWFYTNIFSTTGQLSSHWIDSLSAFFPGLQVLYGDIDDARLKHLMSLKLWDTFGGIPERWEFQTFTSQNYLEELDEKERVKQVLPLEWYPLRPEFIEATYFLYRATKDPFYLNIGYRILDDLLFRFKQECGLSGIQNIAKGEFQDRMETFVISETLKYLYLLFDDDNEIHRSRDNIIFSTEAQPVWLTKEMIQSYEKNRFFNDTIYIDHLKNCEDDEVQTLKWNEAYVESKSKGENFPVDYTTFDENYRHVSLDPDIEKLIPQMGQCPIVHKSKHIKDFIYSPMLSNFDRLFEIDYRYNDTLIKPYYQQKYPIIETDDKFYNNYANPRSSICRFPPSTDSFELMIAFDKDYTPISINRTQENTNHIETITMSSLTGTRKFRIEILEPNDIDTFGQIVSLKDNFQIPRKDIHLMDQPASPNPQNDGIKLYRVTMVDGQPLNNDTVVRVNKTEFLNKMDSQRQFQESGMIAGYNIYKQVMLGGIPVMNLLLC